MDKEVGLGTTVLQWISIAMKVAFQPLRKILLLPKDTSKDTSSKDTSFVTRGAENSFLQIQSSDMSFALLGGLPGRRIAGGFHSISSSCSARN
jgi:hypothetical protein